MRRGQQSKKKCSFWQLVLTSLLWLGPQSQERDLQQFAAMQVQFQQLVMSITEAAILQRLEW